MIYQCLIYPKCVRTSGEEELSYLDSQLLDQNINSSNNNSIIILVIIILIIIILIIIVIIQIELIIIIQIELIIIINNSNNLITMYQYLIK